MDANYSGLVVAGVGFFLTRFTVTLAIYNDPLNFYLAGVVPLALGLGLSVFGVALTVADVDASVVRTTAVWCCIGTATMLGLSVLTLFGSTVGGLTDVVGTGVQSHYSTFLIGGSVGGTLTGLYAARTRSQRRVLRQQTNRLVVLNRLLRHEVLNALTVIKGFVSVDEADHPDAPEIISDRSDDIEQTIEEVKYLTNHAGTESAVGGPVDLQDCLSESVAAIESEYQESSVSVETVPAGLRAVANERLTQVFTHLLENAIVHAGDDSPQVVVSATRTAVEVTVVDDGPGLPESQRALLERGDIGRFDDPRTGYGLNIVRLLVENYGGDVRTAVGNEGTEITVVLPRWTDERTLDGLTRSDLAAVRPALPHLVVGLGTALIAGVAYALVSEFLGGQIAGIGLFYGTVDPVVGWITHEFHSIVFGFVYLGLVTVLPERLESSALSYVGLAIGWGVLVWIVAAGVVAPVWLQLQGFPATVPTFSARLLWSHLVWGLTLGVLTVLGHRYVVPHVRLRLDRVRAVD